MVNSGILRFSHIPIMQRKAHAFRGVFAHIKMAVPKIFYVLTFFSKTFARAGDILKLRTVGTDTEQTAMRLDRKVAFQ